MSVAWEQLRQLLHVLGGGTIDSQVSLCLKLHAVAYNTNNYFQMRPCYNTSPGAKDMDAFKD